VTIRVVLGLLLLVLFSLGSAADALLTVAREEIPPPGQDAISRFERGSNAARVKLPSYTVVRFRSDQNAADDPAGIQDYYLAQYTLAPRVVIQADPPQVVGSYPDGVRVVGGAGL
jgi:hypothetical protein